MRLADSSWQPFVAEATALHERIVAFRREGADEAPAAEPPPQVAERLARWCENAALGRWELLDRRLAWDGLRREDAAALVNGWRPAADGAAPSPPSWLTTLSRVLARVRAGGLPPRPTGEPALPFDRILAPFLAEAEARLDRRLGGSATSLGEEARKSARRALLRRLSLAAAPTLYAEFKALRDRERSPFVSGEAAEREPDGAPIPDRLYLAFVERCASGGLTEILRRSPLLARQLATASEDWAAAIGEIVERWWADAESLAAAFDLPGPLGPIAGLRLDLSDPHNGGRGVAELTDASGWKILYKPKCLAIDAAFYRLISWIDGTGELPPFGSLRLLPREPGGGGAPYGWMEIAVARGCADRAAAERYYERAGRLVALVYALEGSDCHAENVIARGEQPCLIDLETLMNPAAAGLLEDTGVSPATATASRQLYDSVLRTGLLPTWTLTAEGHRIDVSMLGSGSGGDDETGSTQVRVWAHPNSDRMEPRYELRPLPPRSNLPRIAAPATDPDEAGRYAAGDAVPCDGFEPAVLRGFAGMYDFLLRHREELLARPALLPSWRTLRVRYVPRMTRLYGKTLRNLTRASAVRGGVAWSLDVESLCRLWTFLGDKPSGWGLFAHEAAALLRLDVPYFAARADRRDVFDAEGRVLLRDRFEKAPFERLEARLRSLSPDDRERQTGTIRATFLARGSGLSKPRASASVLSRSPFALPAGPLPREAGIRIAEEIGEDLLRSAVRGPGGTATWIALSPLDDSAVCQVKPIGYNLHAGVAGVGLFLAALARVTGDARYEELARAALREVTQALESGAERLAEAIGLGGNLGIGSILYALASAGELLDDRALVRVAAAGARAIRDEAIARDGKLDVVFGSAGCVLALLKVHRAAGAGLGGAALDAALRCGRHLLAARRPTPQGPSICPTMDSGFHTGFSHGAAGVAAALFRLARASGEARFAEAAREMEEWEESLWDEGARGYPDLRQTRRGRGASEAPPPLTAWCHGAPGIALSRLAHLEGDGSATARRAAGRCLEATAGALPAEADHLCCGNAGRVDVLLEASRRLGEPRWAEAAGRLFAGAAARAAEQGGFRLPTGPARAHELPALFTGLSGVGYTGLRWARPESLPSVLLFD